MTRFINYYRHCGAEWQDTWSCQCNDECPECGAEIEPYDSEECPECGHECAPSRSEKDEDDD